MRTLPSLFLAGLLLPACAAVPRAFVRSDHADLPSSLVEGSPMYRVLAPNAIPALDAPRFDALGDAREVHEPGEPVLVVDVGGDVRVYSTWTLSLHEVVNDVVGGVPVAVTY